MLNLAVEQNPEVLRQAAVILERENRRLIEKNLELRRQMMRLSNTSPDQLQQYIAQLERELEQATRRIVGGNSEKQPRPSSEEPATEDSATPAASAPASERAPRKGHPHAHHVDARVLAARVSLQHPRPLGVLPVEEPCRVTTSRRTSRGMPLYAALRELGSTTLGNE